MTQEEFNEMLARAIAGGLGGGTYISRWDGEEIDAGIVKLMGPGGIATSDLSDASVTTPKLADGAVTWPKLAPEARKSNPNLLDNWYFVGGGSQQGGGQFPINQRGLTEYTTAGYTIDRWGSFRNGTISLTADGIAITPRASGNMFFYQIMENPSQLEGKTITLSALLKGDVGLSGNLWLSKQSHGELKRLNYECTGDWQLVSLTFDVPQGSGFYAVGTMVYANTIQTPVTYAAMKLELGPNQTLVYESAGGWSLNDPAPNFADELMRCQRYQWKSKLAANGYYTLPHGIALNNTTLVVVLPLPTTMRSANPAISFSAGSRFGCWNAEEGSWLDSHLITNIIIDQYSGDSVELKLITADLIPGRPYEVQTKGGFILLDNNL